MENYLPHILKVSIIICVIIAILVITSNNTNTHNEHYANSIKINKPIEDKPIKDKTTKSIKLVKPTEDKTNKPVENIEQVTTQINKPVKNLGDKSLDDLYSSAIYYSNNKDGNITNNTGIIKCLNACTGKCVEYGITGNAFCFE